MKRLIPSRSAAAIVLAGIVVLPCPVHTPSANSASAAGLKHLGMIIATRAGTALPAMVQGGLYASYDVGGIDLQIVGPTQLDGPLQVKMLQTLAASARDGIVEENLTPALFTKPIAQIIAKGIPVVAMDSVPTPGSNVSLYVGNDDYAMGQTLAQQVIKALPARASGTIVVNDPIHGSSVFGLRAQGAVDAFAKVVPKVKIVESYASCMAGLDAACHRSILSVVKANAHALAIVTTNSTDAYILAQVKQEVGGKFLIAGFDLAPQTLQAIKDGSVLCTISPEQYLKGYVATRLLAEAAQTGKPLPKGWFDLPGVVIDQSLVDVIMIRQLSDANMRDWLRPEIAKIFDNITPYMRPLSAAR